MMCMLDSFGRRRQTMKRKRPVYVGKRCEAVAKDTELVLRSPEYEWAVCEEHPHVTPFEYEVRMRVPGDADFATFVAGTVQGYILAHDWTASDTDLWDEGDALDGDVCAYADSLIRELRACKETFDSYATLSSMQRVLIIKHIEPKENVDAPQFVRDVVATLVMKETPKMTLVDPWPYSREEGPTGKLEGRSRIATLLPIGFHRMVGSRFVWAWDAENSDNLMFDYSYNALLAAKRAGKLDAILKKSVAEDVYGVGVARVLDQVHLPDPKHLMEE
jgi:hypothetical protein